MADWEKTLQALRQQFIQGSTARLDRIRTALEKLGSNPSDREARKQKFKRLDPESRWQSIGYDYLTDETGLTLEPVPEVRDFRATIPG